MHNRLLFDFIGGATGVLPAPVFGLLGVWLGAFMQDRKDDKHWVREEAQERLRWQREDRARWPAVKHERYDAIVVAADAVRQATRDCVRCWGKSADIEITRPPTTDEAAAGRRGTREIQAAASRALVVGTEKIHLASLDCSYFLQGLITAIEGNDVTSASDMNRRANGRLDVVREAKREELGMMP